MCGVPYHAVEGYLAKLIGKGYRNYCEQVEDQLAKGIVKRIIRIVTPGTVLKPIYFRSSQLSLSCILLNSVYGIAYTDISTGEFRTTEISGDGSEQKLFDEIARINPAEIILPLTLYHDEPFRQNLTKILSVTLTKLSEDKDFLLKGAQIIKNHFRVHSLEALGLSDLPAAVCAVGMVLIFLSETQKKDLVYLQDLSIYSISSFMMIDQVRAKFGVDCYHSRRSKVLCWV